MADKLREKIRNLISDAVFDRPYKDLNASSRSIDQATDKIMELVEGERKTYSHSAQYRRVEMLTAENKRMREALEEIAKDDDPCNGCYMVVIAQKALGER